MSYFTIAAILGDSGNDPSPPRKRVKIDAEEKPAVTFDNNPSFDSGISSSPESGSSLNAKDPKDSGSIGMWHNQDADIQLQNASGLNHLDTLGRLDRSIGRHTRMNAAASWCVQINAIVAKSCLANSAAEFFSSFGDEYPPVITYQHGSEKRG